MKNAESKLSQTLSLYYQSRYRLILTGTPLQVSCLYFLLSTAFGNTRV